MVQAAPYLSDHTNHWPLAYSSDLSLVWMGHANGQARLNPLPRVSMVEPLACACVVMRSNTSNALRYALASYNSTLDMFT